MWEKSTKCEESAQTFFPIEFLHTKPSIHKNSFIILQSYGFLVAFIFKPIKFKENVWNVCMRLLLKIGENISDGVWMLISGEVIK